VHRQRKKLNLKSRAQCAIPACRLAGCEQRASKRYAHPETAHTTTGRTIPTIRLHTKTLGLFGDFATTTSPLRANTGVCRAASTDGQTSVLQMPPTPTPQYAASLGIKKHPHTGTRHEGQKGHKSGVQGTEISHRCNRPSFTETLSVSTMSPVELNVGNIDGPTHYCRALGGWDIQYRAKIQ